MELKQCWGPVFEVRGRAFSVVPSTSPCVVKPNVSPCVCCPPPCGPLIQLSLTARLVMVAATHPHRPSYDVLAFLLVF